MSESFEQQISRTVQADVQAAGSFFAEAYANTGTALGKFAGNEAGNSASAHLPSLQLSDSGHGSIKPEAKDGKEMQIDHDRAVKESTNLPKKSGVMSQSLDDNGNTIKGDNPGHSTGTGSEPPLEAKVNGHPVSGKR